MRYSFDAHWPRLEERLDGILAMPKEAPKRGTSDMLSEILALVRRLVATTEDAK